MKKITKFLDSVMGGIKRTCVAKALAVFAVASIAINANAQATNAQGVITGIDKLVGISQEDLLKNTITGTTFPTDVAKQFFLYNVKTGRLLNAGGYWGTHVALKEYGKPLAVIDCGTEKYGDKSTLLKLIMEMKGTEGNFVGWCGVPATTGINPPDVGTYVDRKVGDVYGWVLEPVNDGKNTYRLRTFAHSTFTSTSKDIDTTKKYYLCSNKGVEDADRNCEAYPEESLSEYTGYDQWRFLSYEQILNLQKKNADELYDALELSFKLKCPGFSRGDNDITSWHAYNYKTKILDSKYTEFARYGLMYYYSSLIAVDENNRIFTNDLPSQTKANGTVNKYTFDGVEYYNPYENGGVNTKAENYQRNLAKYYTASITNKRGIVYQDIDVTLPGRYQIECKGYSTTKKASLFAGVLKSDNTMVDKVKKTTLNQVSDMPQTVQDDLHVSEKNVDYAGKNFYGSRQYINTVYVTVPADAMTDGKATIRLGVMVGDDQNDKTVEGDEWTVFDDFRLLYASKTTNADLILDQDRADLQYLLDVKDPLQNKTLRLNKTFVSHKWNTFVLPVDLTLKQLRDAFGPNTRLAQLEKLADTGIQFKSVKLDDKTNDDIVLHAYQPYLIIPEKVFEKDRVDNTKASYTAEFVNGGTGSASQTIKVGIAANHYVIPKVSLSVADLKKIEKKTWATAVSSSIDGKMEAYGTLVRTFGTVNSDVENGYQFTNNGQIIEGRDNLKGCYFFDKGKMYHSTSRPRGLRGFSCWFKPADGTQKNAQVTIDGVTQSGTTALEDIFADGEQTVSRFANGIYNLNGQLVKQGNSTAGLPSGMYIVNGKKCIVR